MSSARPVGLYSKIAMITLRWKRKMAKPAEGGGGSPSKKEKNGGPGAAAPLFKQKKPSFI
jgi:hypothetical protein